MANEARTRAPSRTGGSSALLGYALRNTLRSGSCDSAYHLRQEAAKVSQSICPFCWNPATGFPLYSPSGGIRTAWQIECSTCGRFDVTHLFVVTKESYTPEQRYRLSGLSRNASDRGEIIEFSTDSANKLLEIAPRPTPFEQEDLILEYIEKRTTAGGKHLPVDPNKDYPIAHALGPDGLIFLLKWLVNGEFIEGESVGGVPQYRLTMPGYRRLEERRKSKSVVASEQPPTETVTTPVSTPSQFRPGLKFNQYEIIEVLGEGGMGIVYKARDTHLDEHIALKTLTSKGLQDPKYMSRFKAEIKIARKISHPYVCRVYEYGDYAGLPFFTMELIEGPTLKAELAIKGPLPPSEATQIAIKICEGLSAIHARGIVHRDIKSSNVMMDALGTLRIMDLGIAKDLSPNVTETVSDGVLGSIEYMSPERLSQQSFDGRADIYSVGILLYELALGERPFQGRIEQILFQHMHDEPKFETAQAKALPDALKSVIRKALEKNPGRRFASALEMASALKEDGVPTAISPPPIGRPESPVEIATVAAVSPKEWLEQEERFRRLGKRVQAVWNTRRDTGQVTWSVYPHAGATSGDTQAFIAEARLASQLLVRAGLERVSERDIEDLWLDLVRSLTTPDSDMRFEGTENGIETDGGAIEDLSGRSARACVLLAGGTRPVVSPTERTALNQTLGPKTLPIQERPLTGLGLSVDAQRIAAWINQNSKDGTAYDHFERDALLRELALSEDQAGMAASELSDAGHVKRHVTFGSGVAGFSSLSPLPTLFIRTDPVLRGWDPERDALELAAAMVKLAPDGVATLLNIDQYLGWGPRRINPAADYLALYGYIKPSAEAGSAPYTFAHALIDHRTRRFAEGASGSA